MRSARLLPLVPAFVLVAAIPCATLTELRTAHADVMPPNTMDLDGVKIGMKGYGLTVMSGTVPEKFDIEIVGILSKFRPDQDLILIKAKHPRLDVAHTVAGMSGSPIFLDGKIIGAYAYGWQFGSEPVSGVTPIRNMLQEQRRPVPANLLNPIPIPPAHGPTAPKRSVQRGHAKHARVGGQWEGAPDKYDLKEHAKQIAERLMPTLSAPEGSGLARADTPVTLGGLGDRAAKMASDLLSPLGFETMQGGGAGGAIDPATPTKFTDGSAIGVQLIRGDISAQGLGTVTRVDGDKLVAFGHPMMNAGISTLPTAIAKVHWIMATAIRSFKIGEPARPLGTLVNDGQAAIVIDTTVTAPTFPITVDVEGVEGAPKKHWDMEIAHDRFLSPSFVGVAMGNSVESTVSEHRDATWTTHTKIQIKGYGAIEVDDFGVAIGGTPNGDEFVRSRATRAIGMVLNNPWEFAQIERVEMKMKIAWNRDVYTIRGAHPLEDVVEPGQKARIEVKFWQFNGPDDARVIEVPIPREYAGKDVDILLVPGWMDSPDLPSPSDLATLIQNIPRSSYAPDTLLAEYRLADNGVMNDGKVSAQIPPSALDTLRGANDSDAVEVIPSLARYPFPVGHFVDGRDHVRVHVRDIVR